MSVDFLFNPEDARRVRGLRRPWDGPVAALTPVFFKKEVLVRYFYDPAYQCGLCSETYGLIDHRDFNLAFGINPNGKVVAWLCDLRDLPEDEQRYLALYNVPSDGDLGSEFYDAQIEGRFTDPIFEVELILLKTRLTELISQKHGFQVYGDFRPSIDAVFAQCAKFKRILFNHEDDFKRFVSEWNEILIEDLQSQELRRFLQRHSMPPEKILRGLKLFERFVQCVSLGPVDLAPLFNLHDMRIWADHRAADRKLDDVLGRLGMPRTVDHKELYNRLIHDCCSCFRQLLQNL